jgi:L,D-peptidoglycan transpeptidase YkuD (ErfK/YbiS/YcfS/YnhG family)
MLRTYYKQYNILLILILCISFVGCGKEEVAISLNQDAFNNQNASTDTNQSFDTTKVLPESKDLITPPVTISPEDSSDDIEEVEEPSEEVEQTFDNTSETVYATANVNIRSYYTKKENNVIAVLSKGEGIKRIGISDEWSQVEFKNSTGYIMSVYLTKEQPAPTVTPTPAPESTATPIPKEEEKPTISSAPTPSPEASNEEDAVSNEYSFVSSLAIAKDIDELVCVIGSGGSDCTVSFHKKDKDGNWRQIFSTDGDNGSDGITYQKREGDGKTPAGLYSFTLAFGLKSDPGAYLNYRKITEDDYWIDDINSPLYNTWVNAKDTPGEYTSEHLIDHSPSYNYALNINYNPECVPGLGSAVFLHCYNGSGYTTGCIAISESKMKTLVKEADNATRILIVPSEDALADY